MINPNRPPHNPDAEASVLGCILLDERLIAKTEEVLSVEDFYAKKNQLIYDAMLSLNGEGQSLDIVTVAERLNNLNQFKEIGGYSYLTDLVNQVPVIANHAEYCHIVKEQALVRQLVDASMEIINDCYGEFEQAADIVERAEQKIFKVGQGKSKGDFLDAKAVVMETIDYIEKIRENQGKLTGLSTGFSQLDFMTSGLQNSDLIYIAARPSMGKTAFALNIVSHVAIKQQGTVAIFSLEMSRTQLMQRLICSYGLIDLSNLRSGNLSEDDWRLLGDASATLYNTGIHIDDTGGATLPEIRSKCRRLKASKGLDLVVIDYLQLMGSARRIENRQNEVSEISRGLKALARELDCPIVCLSQLSRGPEIRQDHTPNLADLRESGSIEQDADVVLFLYRDYYYTKDEASVNAADVIIAKQRNGPTGKIELSWRPEYTRFMDIANIN